MELAGQVALVTGAGRRDGLGAAVARWLAREGAAVVVADRAASELEDVRAALAAQGVPALALAVDITDPVAVEALVSQTVTALGRLDILVNNAGGSWLGDEPLDAATVDFVGVTNCTLEQWRAIVALNLDGAFYCARAVAPQFIRQRGGRIVNVSALSARRGVPPEGLGSGPYGVAKAGLHGLTKQLALELAPYGVRVNAVAPGLIATGRTEAMLDALSAPRRAARLHAVPLGRLGTVDEVAALVVALCTDATSYLTGAILDVNGGAYLA